MVIGVNHHTAPVAVRERFWISEPRRCEALMQLSHAEAIDEVAVLVNGLGATPKEELYILYRGVHAVLRQRLGQLGPRGEPAPHDLVPQVPVNPLP